MTTRTAVVFDMDGVLVDTEPVWDRVRRGLASADGRMWTASATTDMQGMSTIEWAQFLIDVIGVRGERDAVIERVVSGLQESYREHLPVLPGAEAAIRRMAARPAGVIAVASSSPRRIIDTVLTELGVHSLFAATVSTEEVAAGKPAPDGYLSACRQIGVDPAQAVAVEDSSNGLRSAAAAGMAVVAIPNPFNPPAPDALALADAVLNGLDELTSQVVDSLLTGGS